jgi:hypothetical protein
MVEPLNKILMELKIEYKLLTITVDNAANNKTLVSEPFFCLAEKFPIAIQPNIQPNIQSNTQSNIGRVRFQGIDSYILCLTHIPNLIVQDILAALKAGNYKTAVAAYDLMQENKEIGTHSVMTHL